MIYALALGSNAQREHWLQFALQRLATLGNCQLSDIYEIPCRQGKGADYYNLAVLLHSNIDPHELEQFLVRLEHQAGRVRPSQRITLDIDLIAYGITLSALKLVAKRLPLPFDVSLPLAEIWQDCPVSLEKMPNKKLKITLK